MSNDFLHALVLYDVNFVNDSSTLVIIDEVQEAPILYDYIKKSIIQNRTYIILSGSYLNQKTRLNFLQISDKVESLRMEPLSFQEFYDCLQENEELLGVDKQKISVLEKLKTSYRLYQIYTFQ